MDSLVVRTSFTKEIVWLQSLRVKPGLQVQDVINSEQFPLLLHGIEQGSIEVFTSIVLRVLEAIERTEKADGELTSTFDTTEYAWVISCVEFVRGFTVTVVEALILFKPRGFVATAESITVRLSVAGDPGNQDMILESLVEGYSTVSFTSLGNL